MADALDGNMCTSSNCNYKKFFVLKASSGISAQIPVKSIDWAELILLLALTGSMVIIPIALLLIWSDKNTLLTAAASYKILELSAKVQLTVPCFYTYTPAACLYKYITSRSDITGMLIIMIVTVIIVKNINYH